MIHQTLVEFPHSNEAKADTASVSYTSEGDPPLPRPIAKNYGSIQPTPFNSRGASPTLDTPSGNPEGSSPTLSPVPESTPASRPSALQILRDSTVRRVLLSYGCLAVISTSNDVIFALWMFLPPDTGGIGFSVCRGFLSYGGYTDHFAHRLPRLQQH